MDTQRLLAHFSLKIIIQFAIAIVLLLIAVAYNYEFLDQLYLKDQPTNTGIIINSGIICLLFIGLFNILYHLFRYHREENAVAAFIDNIESVRKNPTVEINPNSMIVKRYDMMRAIKSVSGEINHSALAAMLTADESTKMALIRFINNILILTGVFGTIVSLSIALLGASDLIENATTGIDGMGLVIHGMSTALSTTITAIVSYMLFGYFFMRVINLQTHILSGIEQLTSVYLLPRFVKRSEDVTANLDDLIKAVSIAAQKLNQTQDLYLTSAQVLHKTISSNKKQMDELVFDISSIKQLLRDGFRLPESK